MKFYTIGYGGRKPEDFLNLLREKEIVAVVDVRLRADHSSMGCYAKAKSEDKGIQGLLKSASIAYYSFIELGNIFLNQANWAERYQRFFLKAGELLIENLQEVPPPFALLCAERNPNNCHRKIIADYLTEKGWEVTHVE